MMEITLPEKNSLYVVMDPRSLSPCEDLVNLSLGKLTALRKQDLYIETGLYE